MDYIALAKKNFLKKESNLSPYATKSGDAIRLNDQQEDIRPPYFHDIDRIIHSMSYTRYANKTQVYSEFDNDHISSRMVHVQLVSKIARTIGRALNLNEDLIEAIALGHDIGHTPLGHSGEAMIAKICKQELDEDFAHNIQGVRYYMNIAKDGSGYNLTVQVLDGIMCHNGELLSPKYEPEVKTPEEFLQQYHLAYHDLKQAATHRPMTLEGCVVRISDIIGYIGRDIEDAIRLNKIKREDIPTHITTVLGSTNREIVNTLIVDIIEQSLNKPYIKLSDSVYQALMDLKKFNYTHIYRYSQTVEEYQYYEHGMQKLYRKYLEDIKSQNKKSIIYTLFLDHQSTTYLQSTNDKRKVIDFLCGMTDDLFIKQVKMLDKS